MRHRGARTHRRTLSNVVKIRRYAVVMVALLLYACSGSTIPTQMVVPPVSPMTSGTPSPADFLTFEIGVLKPSAQPKRTDGSEAWFSPATRSVSIRYTVVRKNRGHVVSQAFNVGRGMPHCNPDPLGSLCRFVIQYPQLAGRFQLNAHDKPLTAKGNVSGTVLAEATAVSTKTGKVTFSVLGLWQKIKVLSVNTAPVNGVETNLGLKLSIEDADGYAVYGTYRGSINVGFRTVPWSETPTFKVLVNGKRSGTIDKSSDSYSAIYLGRGVVRATLVVGSHYELRRVPILPVETSLAVAASPPLSSSS
ncbi:MAG TPA: hypothetical protein VKB39_07305, partial [Candidatus Baltobacteraceae bacterium]|nr:hypothetical protein [Candidatus Baltobacteraceae bacterium]